VTTEEPASVPVFAPTEGVVWEYALLSHEVERGLEDLRESREQVSTGVFPPSAKTLADFASALTEVQNALGELWPMIASLKSLLSPSALEAACGQPGTPGDEAAIRALGAAICQTCGEMISWACEIGGAEAPEQTRELLRATAQTVNGPLSEVERAFSEVASATLDIRSGAAAGAMPPGRTLNFKVDLTPDLSPVDAAITGLSVASARKHNRVIATI
jgi:hypothetical protein